MPKGRGRASRLIADLAHRYRVTDGRGFRLKDIDPGETAGLDSELKDEAAALLQRGVERLAELQQQLWAEGRWALLLVVQAMDAAGKDSTIKHVMSGVNPQGCEVHAFKAPSPEELDHDYLWRCARRLPERGRIGIFNRSYYEEVLVVRVHRELLDAQHLPRQLVTRDIWSQRYDDIRAWERYLARNGIVVRKFFLHVSREEQQRRFVARLEDPEKHWKFALNDVKERAFWDDYMRAYEAAIRQTATAHAPWYVVPADHKWFTRLVVAAAIVDTLRDLRLAYPKLDRQRRAELRTARRLLAPKRT
jgi:PPK2 family polyphosphate:nucleotide phosphotransferase